MLDLNEAIALSSEAIALGEALVTDLHADSDGGKRITKAEALALVHKAVQLAATLLSDIAD